MEEKQKELKLLLQSFKSKHPYVENVVVYFQGAGDSFEEFYDQEIKYNEESLKTTVIDEATVESDLDLLYWKIINLTGADFNNDGCEGDIVIDFKNHNYECNVNHIEYERRIYDSECVVDSFGLNGTVEFEIE